MTPTHSRQTPTVGRPPEDAALTEAAVAEFLATHSDFLSRHAELLEQLTGDNAPDGVTSLVERQVVALRNRNAELRERLGVLITNARTNDRIFARMRALTVALMDAEDEATLDQALATSLVEGFDADHARCFLAGFSPRQVRAHLAGVAGEPPLATLFTQEAPSCAAYRPDEYSRVFPGATVDAPASIALVPLPVYGPHAALAIGAADPNRFTPDLGHMFLVYLGDVLGRTLKRVLGPGR